MDKDLELTENSGGFFSIFDSVTGIIVFIVLCLILILIAYVVIKRLGRRMEARHDRRSIKDDLMIWSNLSRLVSGGAKTQEEKEELSGSIRLLKLIFETALSAIRNSPFRRHSKPWFVVLGEPLSGKTTLLKTQSLNLTRLRGEMDTSDEECLHFNVNSSTVFLDVKGKIFFDNWLGGSSAQWQAICSLIAKYHRKKPLSGIVLTIPADALIADDRNLCLRKAGLIASELQTLTRTLNMKLPCRIVITKCDCIVGFREYFSGLSEKLSDQVIGFRLSETDGIYEKNEFTNAFENFTGRIEKGVAALMLSKQVLEKSHSSSLRMDVSGYIFSFPRHLKELGYALEIYLETVFGRNSSEASALIEGVYFCSSTDQGVCLSQDFAALSGKKTDEAVMTDDNPSLKKPYFVGSLFTDSLLSLDLKASFTRSEKLRRSFPKTALVCFLGIISFAYLFGAVGGRALIYHPLNHDLAYYVSLKTMFDRNSIQRSPLFGCDSKTGEGTELFNNLMLNDARMSRINFFNDAKSVLLSRKPLPLVYSPSSYLFYEWNNLSAKDRKTIYNQMLVDMVFIPATSSFAYRLLKDDSLFTEQKADALIDYMYLSIAKKQNSSTEMIEKCLRSIMKYEYPNISQELKSQLTDIENDGDDAYSYAATTQILLDPNYKPSIDRAIRQYQDQILSVTAYPETSYQQARIVLSAGQRLMAGVNYLVNQQLASDASDDTDELMRRYTGMRDKLGELLELCRTLDKYRDGFIAEYASLNQSKVQSAVSDLRAKSKKDDPESANLLRRGILETSYRNYRKLITDDFDTFNSYTDNGTVTSENIDYNHFSSANISQFRAQVKSNLENSFSDLLNLMQTVNRGNLFDYASGQKSHGYLNYELLSRLLNIVYVSDKDLDISFNKPSEFEENFRKVVSVYKDRRDRLDRFLSASSIDDGNFGRFINGFRKYMDFAEYESKVAAVNRLLSLYPNDSSRTKNLAYLSELIANQDGSYNYDEHFSFDLASEVLGDIDINPDFSPAAYSEYIKPVLYLSSYINAKDSNKDSFSRYLAGLKNFDKIRNYVLSYTDSYVNYWASFPDSIRLNISDYAMFHDYAQNSKAYQVNSQLLDIYNFAYDVLSFKEDSPLLKKTDNSRELALKNIENRRRTISLNFTEACNNVLSSWALLPDDAVRANYYLKTLNRKQIRNDFTIVKSSQSSGYDIPWWSSFVNLGTALLKSEANFRTAEGLDEFQSKLYFFPILKDAAIGSMTLEPSSMKLLKRKLNSYGLGSAGISVKTKDDNLNDENESDQTKDPLSDDIQEPLLTDVTAGHSDLKEWVDNVNLILSVLSDNRNPLIATVSVPSLDKQNELVKEYKPGAKVAALRYRYVEVKSLKTAAERFGTVVEDKDRVIFKNRADAQDLIFTFYRFSDDLLPEATVKFEGRYSPLRMYLNDKAVYSQEEKSCYVPVKISGKNGESGVLFLKISFNRELIEPDKWPSSENWPLITQF